MSTYTIGQYNANAGYTTRGQSFTPNVAGGGTGIPSGATSVVLVSAMFAFTNSDITNRPGAVYLYDYKPSITDLNHGTNALAASTSNSDENGFGAGTYTRTFYFGSVNLDITKKYYLLFPLNQTLRGMSGDPYSGGEMFNGMLVAQTSDLQFEVVVADA